MLSDSLKGLMAEIAYRVPESTIFLRKNQYLLNSSRLGLIPIKDEDITTLVEMGYLIRNGVGGVKPSTKAYDEADSYYTRSAVPTEGHPGKLTTVISFPFTYEADK